MTQRPPVNRIQVEIPMNLRANYANFAIISHTAAEFFIDFAQLLPGLNKSQVHTRMVMSPSHAKMLLKALAENVERYENQNGPINVPPSLADQLFGGIKPIAPNESNNEPNNENE